MNAAVFTDSASASACQAACDATLGYPRTGVDIGAGVHAPPAQSITVTYFAPLKHPTLAEWAYLADGVTTPCLTAPVAATVQALDATWFPVAQPLTAQAEVR